MSAERQSEVSQDAYLAPKTNISEEIRPQNGELGPPESVSCITREEGAPQPGTSIPVVSCEAIVNMEVDDSNRAQKRKNRPVESDIQGDSEEEIMRPPKLRPRNRRVLLDDEQKSDTLTDFSQMIPTAGGGGAAVGFYIRNGGGEEQEN